MRDYLKKVLFIIGLIYLVQPIIAQPERIDFERITINDGLSQNTAYDIMQDRFGFLWIATANGLNKYNGYEFIVYNIELDESTDISDNKIESIIEDHLGMIWLGTRNGLNRYDEAQNKFVKYFYDHQRKNSLCSNIINDLVEDKYQNLWIATENGLSKYIRESDTFENYFQELKDSNSLPSDYLTCLISDVKGNLWIGTNNGIALFDPIRNNFIKLDSILSKFKKNIIYSLLEDHNGDIWIGTDIGELNKYVVKENKLYNYKYKDESSDEMYYKAYALYEDKNGIIWIATYSGLYGFDGVGFKRYSHNFNNIRSISSDRVQSFYEDKSGVFWVGTNGGGLNKFDNNRQKFQHIKKESGEHELLHNVIFSLEDDGNNKLWIATWGGLSHLDLRTGKYTNYINDPGNNKSISNNQIWCLCKDSDGKLWIGTEKGVNVFDPKTEIFTRYFNIRTDSTSLSANPVYSIIEDHKKNIWVGTMRGLNKFNRKTEKFIRYFNVPEDKTSISNNLIWNFWEDRFDTLWVATDNGLNKYNRELNTFKQYYNDSDDQRSISGSGIYCFVEDESGELWIGTNVGINKYLREEEEFLHYTEKDGLVDNIIYGILADDHNNLWMSSNSGIMMFNQDKKIVKNYTVYDGLQSNEFNFAHCKLEDGKMLFGGGEGFNIFHPDSIMENKIIPSVSITDFKLFNESVKVGEEIGGRVILKNMLSETKEIHLKYDENVFSIEFAALHYVSPNRNQYAYMMEGLNDDWEYIGNRRFVPYTKIPSGEYTFRVIASNNDGYWNKEGASLKIIIIPPFWKRAWFQLGFILLLAASIYSWVFLRLRNTRLQKEKLEFLVRERTKELIESNATKDKFFSIISHDLKSPFNALLGFAEILDENKGNLSKEKTIVYNNQIFTSAKKLYGLIENLLAWSRTKTDRIENFPEIVNLKDIVLETISIFNLNSTKKNISIRPEINKNTFVYVDINLISTVLRNLISNAIKFSHEGGEIKILADDIGDFIKVAVIDSGVGISKEDIQKLFKEEIHFTRKGTQREEGTGLGLILCKQFVEMNGGEIMVTSTPGKETTFAFTLPKGK